MKFRIVAPHFVAGCHNGRCAPIIKYMADWPIARVQAYCKIKNWTLEQFPENISSKEDENVKTILRSAEQMSDYSNIFGKIGAAKPMGGGFAQRLGLGTHRLALKSYKVKDSTKGQGQFLEAEFVVVKSSTHPTGETRGWVWFINAPGAWAGAYEQARAKAFLETVGACIGDESPVEVIGAGLAGPNQGGKGLVIEVEITPQGGKNAGKLNQRGEPYTNATWKPVKQTLEELAASRVEIDNIVVEAPATQPVKTGLGLLGK